MDFGKINMFGEVSNRQYLEKLYSFDKRGKLRVFEIWLENTEEEIVIINTSTGYVNGKMSNKKTYVTKAFQKRNLLQQAVLEMESKISNKLDEGYKSAKMYMDRFYDGKNIYGSEELFMSAVEHDDTIPKFDTNRDWIPRPMLAQPYSKSKDKETDSINYLIQPKLDGVRCLALMVNGKVTLMSRGGNYYYMPHIEREVEPILAKFNNFILDGELYIHNTAFERISGLCRLGLNAESVQSSIIDEKSIIEYHIYDIFDENKSLKQHERTSFLLEAHEQFKSLYNIRFVNTELVTSKEQIKEYHDNFVEDGYEGAILRHPKGEYEVGIRSKSLLKVKEFKEAEFRIVGYKVDTKQTVEDSFVFQLYSPNGDFYCRPKGSRSLKLKYHDEIDKLIGKRATVRYLDVTNTGLPGKAHVKEIRNYE